MPYKGGVQFLPETERRPTLSSYTSGNKYFYVGAFLAAVVIVVGAILGGYSRNLTDRIAKLDGQLDQTDKQRNKEHEQALVSAQKQSKVMRSLLTSKIYWSQAFGYIQQMIQSGVKLTSLNATSKGTISFSAVAPDYATVARQIAALVAGTGVKDVNVRSVKSNTLGKVEFDAELTVDPQVMLNKKVTK